MNDKTKEETNMIDENSETDFDGGANQASDFYYEPPPPVPRQISCTDSMAYECEALTGERKRYSFLESGWRAGRRIFRWKREWQKTTLGLLLEALHGCAECEAPATSIEPSRISGSVVYHCDAHSSDDAIDLPRASAIRAALGRLPCRRCGGLP